MAEYFRAVPSKGQRDKDKADEACKTNQKSKTRIVSLVNDHRANDLLYGHAGRITYVPSEKGKSDGHLYTNRLEQNVSFQEVVPFTTWQPATRPPNVEERRVKDQFAWLMKNVPTALVGTVNAGTRLAEKVAASRWARDRFPRLPLLAIGEVTQFIETRRLGLPAVAMAVGDSGHILRLALLDDQEWAFPAAASASTSSLTHVQFPDVSLHLARDEVVEEGHWCTEGFISQVQFAVDRRQERPVRWVLVQTARGTTVFAPQLGAVALKGNQNRNHAGCDYKGRGTPMIQANPIFRIPIEDTGGAVHVDVAFQAEAEDTEEDQDSSRSPQLAIFDRDGNWSVWNVAGDRRLRQAKLHPVLHMRGRLMDDVPSNPSFFGVREAGDLHRIMWLRRSGHEGSQPQPPMLLLADDSAVSLLDTKTASIVCRLEVTRHNGLDAVVDLHPCPTKASRVFVLTTGTLFWLDLEEVQSTTTQCKHPIVLLSTPHLQKPLDQSLKLSVVSVSLEKDRKACLVAVYSMLHKDVQMFWFVEPTDKQPASYERQHFQFTQSVPEEKVGNRKKKKNKGKMHLPGDQTLLLFPRSVVHNAAPAKKWQRQNIDTLGTYYEQAGVGFFQAVSLTAGLELRSALCASVPSLSPSLPTKIAPPSLFATNNKTHTQRWRPLHKRKREIAGTFVVSDDVDQRKLPHLDGGQTQDDDLLEEARAKRRRRRQTQQQKPTKLYALPLLHRLLDEHFTGLVEDAAREAAAGEQQTTPLMRHVVERVVRDHLQDGLHYTTLTNVANAVTATMTDPTWANQLDHLSPLLDEQIQLFNFLDPIYEGSDEATTLYDKLCYLCAVDKDDPRAAYVANMAVKVFLSQIAVQIHPAGPKTSSQDDDHELRPFDPMGSSPPRMASSTSFLQRQISQAREGIRLPALEEDAAEDRMETVEHDEPEEGPEKEAGEEKEDETIARLRNYALSVDTMPPQHTDDLRLMTHWELGTDPMKFSWQPRRREEEEQRRKLEEAREKQLRKAEKRAERRARRSLLLGGTSSQVSVHDVRMSSPLPRIHSSQVGGGGGASESVPVIRSSQARPILSSQVHSSQVRPTILSSSQPMSSQLLSSQRMGSSQVARKKKKKVHAFH